jgi:hypothetical protein
VKPGDDLTVAFDIVHRRRQRRSMNGCKECSEVRAIRTNIHLVALRATKITASDPPSTWWPGER